MKTLYQKMFLRPLQKKIFLYYLKVLWQFVDKISEPVFIHSFISKKNNVTTNQMDARSKNIENNYLENNKEKEDEPVKPNIGQTLKFSLFNFGG